ncbi:MAG TPA: glycosyltransferase [Lapillicoccus sp.]|nr:glycosyltransferase [Lapillicoccus sp.]
MTRYLLAMWDGGGAVPPELGVARRLVERGHEVRVLGDPTLRDQVLAAGASFVPWETAPHRVTGDHSEDIVKDWEVSNPIAGLQRIRDRLLAGPAAAVAADTTAQLRAWSPDVLLADYFMFGAVIAGQAARLPVAALVPNIWALPVRGVPPLGGGFPLAKGPLGRARDALLVSVTNRIFAAGLPTLNAARAAYGLAPLTSFYDQVLTADRILVLTSPTFDYAAPFVPSDVRYLGPVLDDPTWTQPWTPMDPDDGRPVVLIALSSTFQDQADLLQRILDALATLPVRGIATTGPAVDPLTLCAPDNVDVVRSAPHQPILEKASVVITHCGHGTTLKTLAAGVPMVCLPMGRDQDDTAARVVHHGAGVRLKPSAPVARIRRAVTAVLDNPGYRRAAVRLAHAIDSERDPAGLLHDLESLSGHRQPLEP